MRLGRRLFIIALALVGVGYGIFRSWRTLGVFLTGADREVSPVAGSDRFRSRQTARVAAVGGRDLKAMVDKAVSLLSEIERLEFEGKTVLVKPNVVGERAHPTTTNPAVVAAVVEYLYEAGAATVYVGDMSALIRGSTAANMERTGIAGAARGAGAKLLNFEDYGWIRVKVDGSYVREVDVAEWLFKVDKVINLPVLKTHRYAGYSICLKNFVGATHFSHRPYLIDRQHWEEVVAELNLAFRADLHIVDGTRTMVEGGPWQGKSVETNLLLASGDPVACDAVGLSIIKSFGQWPPLNTIPVWQMRQLKRAAELGLGASGSEAMELLTASLDHEPSFGLLMQQVRDLIAEREQAA